MSKRAEELAAEWWNNGPTSLGAIEAMLTQYGLEVREAARTVALRSIIPGEPRNDPYCQGMRVGGNDACAMVAQNIRDMPLP